MWTDEQVERRFKVALWVLSKISIWSVASPDWGVGFKRTEHKRIETVDNSVWALRTSAVAIKVSTRLCKVP